MKVVKSIHKSSVAFVLLLAILLSIFVPVMSASATGIETQTDIEAIDASSTLLVEDGSKQISLGASSIEEVKIGDEKGLRDVANRVNSGDTMEDVRVVLTADIVLDAAAVWVPIGSDALKPFSGIFDGNGHKISGLKVAEDTEGGLFGYIKEAFIKSVILENYYAPKSTYGFFFSATSSTVEFSQSKNEAQAHLSAFAMSPRAASSVGWNSPGTYNTDIRWFGNGKAKAVLINTPDQLAGVAAVVNGASSLPASVTQNTLDGWTFILNNNLDLESVNWAPIGAYDLSVNSFMGRFVGNGNEISNLKITDFDPYGTGTQSDSIGLFGNIDNAVITDFTLNGVDISSTITATEYIGSVVGFSWTSNVSNIIVRNANIDIDANYAMIQTGGIAGYFQEGSIADCLVIGQKGSSITKISTSNAALDYTGGIAGTLAAESAQRLVVYGMTVEGYMVGGIAGSTGMGNVNICDIQKTLVMGCTIGALNDYSNLSGISTNGNGFYVHDSIVSDINMIAGAQSYNNAVGLDLYLYQSDNFAQYIFTDSPINKGFIMDFGVGYEVSDKKVSNNYWDNISPHTHPYTGNATPAENMFGNKGLPTARLADGTWVPNLAAWQAATGYYPQLTELQNHENQEIQNISNIAAIPIVSEDTEQNYVIGSQKLSIPTHTSSNDKITWTGIHVVAGLDITTQDGETFLTTKNDFITIPEVTAKVNGLEKTFQNLTVIDSHLELISKPVSGQFVAKDTVFRLEFGEEIKENPDRLEEITLNALVDGKSVPRKQIFAEDDGTTASPFKIVADSSGVHRFLDIGPLNLDNGVEYELILPQGIVREEVTYGGTFFYNASEDASFTFKTAAVSSPIIQISDPVVYYSVSAGVNMSEMLSMVTVWSQENADLMVDKGAAIAPAVFAELNSSLWDKANPTESISAAVKNTTEFPLNSRTVRYIIDEPAVLTADRKAGTYRLYIIAKNEEHRVSTNVLTIKLEGIPDWLIEPQEAVHMPWTNNLDSVVSAAKQDAMAITKETNASGVEKDVVCPVTVSYDKAEWGVIAEAEEGPRKIVVKVQALSASGLLAREKDVTVYLDKHLNMVMTPSPVIMAYSTKRQIEEKINPVALNFNKDIIEFDHWSNNYRKSGLYYVDLVSDPQDVTYCKDKKCPYPGEHPSDSISETFIINMIYPPAEEFVNKWGDAARIMLEDGKFSKDITEIVPTSYLLPEAILKTLDSMDYGRVQFNFGDDYRWNLYSSTLNKVYRWNEFYSLKINPAENDAVTNLIGGKDKGVQMEFTHHGRLFGKAEVEFKLDTNDENIKELMSKELGLYVYNEDENSLELVSDVFIVDNQWASAAIDYLFPTTYVIKEKEAGDIIVRYETDFTPFKVIVKRNEQGDIIDQDPKLVKSYDELAKIMNLSVDYQSSMTNEKVKMEEKTKKQSILAITAASILALVFVGGGIVVWRRKVRGGEEQNEK